MTSFVAPGPDLLLRHGLCAGARNPGLLDCRIDVAAALNPRQFGDQIVAACDDNVLASFDPGQQLRKVCLGLADLHRDGCFVLVRASCAAARRALSSIRALLCPAIAILRHDSADFAGWSSLGQVTIDKRELSIVKRPPEKIPCKST